MTIDTSNINNLWGSLIVEELIRNGVNYFVISVGSRSTPLTVAVARHPNAEKIVCFDERAAAFHALGYARATLNPAVVICTSGTAAANYFPAVIEASTDCVPLIVLSGDRPPELRQTGANQTIQQFNLYGEYVKWQFDLPCPDEKIPPQMVLTTIDQAVYQARKSPSGSVHLNCMFREPLAPTNAHITDGYLDSLTLWQKQKKPYTQYTSSQVIPDADSVNQIADIINQTQWGILAVGQLKSDADVQAVSQLAEKLNLPVFTDIQSRLRLDSHTNVINYFDLLLIDYLHSQKPLETILQIGSRITSKRFMQLIEHQTLNYIVVTDDPFRHDPSHNVSWRIEASISQFCQQLLPAIAKSINSHLLIQLQQQSQLINQTIDDFLGQSQEISEPGIARIISRYIPKQHGLFLANSMPIRDMDMYAVCEGSPVAVSANRGTSGIEGTIASAAGFAVGLNSSVTVLIGDLSFLYDLNSLALLKSLSQPLIIVVVNNDGGGIFSFLPIAQFHDVFEPYFGVSHQLEFKYVAKMFGIDYYHPETTDAFLVTYQTAISHQRHAVIEVTTDRNKNYALHQDLQQLLQTHGKFLAVQDR
ncbi:2-succinyl-5-enolpyruvyl-6-hydroxy-3-cyclohexene-1-carboxylic-acid synthase [Iningainema sp. BLCCT55]|uniref:2-succinyl-5-enolpyruvyl-6-hydroxy-3-cyclohexene-1-carboxylate synthase n=1 Tax=Iningainema tapete BLCC-T55 TaxID=2748662 RepID=A0A8J7BXN7_9CYAN|nr:2-succinyl-5-enolpyruvyl-6-hydroxy-3-cyclohexene-1-carboxylic-acid synthase [Iningainema tapete BLCC-T55]